MLQYLFFLNRGGMRFLFESVERRSQVKQSDISIGK